MRNSECATVHEALPLEKLIANWAETDPNRVLVFADEEADTKDAAQALAPYAGRQVAVLIGPEADFHQKNAPYCGRKAFVFRSAWGPAHFAR